MSTWLFCKHTGFSCKRQRETFDVTKSSESVHICRTSCLCIMNHISVLYKEEDPGALMGVQWIVDGTFCPYCGPVHTMLPKSRGCHLNFSHSWVRVGERSSLEDIISDSWVFYWKKIWPLDKSLVFHFHRAQTLGAKIVRKGCHVGTSGTFHLWTLVWGPRSQTFALHVSNCWISLTSQLMGIV